MNPASFQQNPFPGLRPFTPEEDYLFFGREEQTLELLQRLGDHRFVAVVGTSGSGKSSLVRCGLLSELLGGRMLGAGSSWEIAVTHPGGNPLALLTDALLDADLYDRHADHARENLLATLSRSHFGLIEAIKQSDIAQGTNFLLVVDQFEEIFRFQDAGQRQQEAANEFVSLLLEAVSQKEVPVYVVLTMRSDFIGECGQFEGLAEMVNRGEFLIPRLTREQYKRVIEGPIKVAGGKIAPRLLQRLLNDLGQQADQLPCLQHALMRTWNVWSERSDAAEIDLDDYQRVGKMSQAMSLHADEIYESLAGDRQRELCRGVFQALTVEETNHRGIRRPQRLGRLCQILEVSSDELRPIIDAFRQSGVTFLMPSPDVALTDQTIVDISHESLMRVWTRLRHWVQEEAQAVGIYRRLSESAGLHAEGKAGLYRDPELGIALAWRTDKRPNQAWAERYHPGFEPALAFLDESHRAQQAEARAQEIARHRELDQARQLADAQQQRAEIEQRTARRLRGLAVVMAVVALFAVGASIVAFQSWRDADAARRTAQVSEQAARTSAEKAVREAERATAQEETATAARRDAEDGLNRARTAIDEFLVQVSESKLLSTPGLQPLRAELLASAGNFYSEFLTKKPGDPRLQAALADAFYRVGSVNGELGRHHEAIVALEKSIELQEATLQKNPLDPDLRHQLAKAWYEYGRVTFASKSVDEADQAVRKAARLWDALTVEHPENVDYRKALARACNILGNTSGKKGHVERSFLAYQRSLQIRLELLEHHPQDVELLHGLSESFNNIGLLTSDPEQQIRLIERSNQYGQVAHRLSPQNVEYASDLAVGFNRLSQRQYQLGRKAEALATSRLGIEHCLRFIRANPAVPELPELLYSLTDALRTYFLEADQADDYANVFRGIRDVLAEMPRQTGEDHLTWALAQTDYAQQLWRARTTFQNREPSPQETADIKAWRSEGVKAIREAVRMGVHDVEKLRNPRLGEVAKQAEFKDLLTRLVSGQDVTQSPDAAVADAPTTPLADDPKTQLLRDQVEGLLAYGAAETGLYHTRQAARSLEQALTLRQTLVDADPTVARRHLDVADVRRMQVRLSLDSGQVKAARDELLRIIADLEKVAARETSEAQALPVARALAAAERDLADLFAEFSLWDDAAPHYAKALRHSLAAQAWSLQLAPSDMRRDSHVSEEILSPMVSLLESSDPPYAAACQQVLTKFQKTSNVEHGTRAARLCVLVPGAVADLGPVVALADKAPYAWHAYTRALVRYRLGEYDEAIRIIQEARQKNELQDIGIVNFLLAMAYFQTDRREEAVQLLKTANAADLHTMPDWTHLPYNMLDVDWLVLRREANQLVHGDTFGPEDRLRRGRGLALLGETERAIREFAAGSQNVRDFPLGYFEYARVLAVQGRKAEAEQVLETARKLRDEQRLTDLEHWRTESQTLRALERHGESIAVWRSMVSVQELQVLRSPQSDLPRWQLLRLDDELADALQGLGRDAEAQALREERTLWLAAFGLPPVPQSVQDLFADPKPRELQVADRLAALNRLLAPDRPEMKAADALRRTLRSRLLQQRAEVLRSINRNSEAVADLAAARALLEELLADDAGNLDLVRWLTQALQVQSDLHWTTVVPVEVKSDAKTSLTRLDDGSILAGGINPPHDLYTLVTDLGSSPVAALRLEAIPDPTLPHQGPGRNILGGFVLDRLELWNAPAAHPDQAVRVSFAQLAADEYDAWHRIDFTSGKWHLGNEGGRPHVLVVRPAATLVHPGGSRLTIRMVFNHGPQWKGQNLGRFRWSVTSDPAAFDREQRWWSTLRLSDPWLKLGVAYAQVDDHVRAVDFLQTAIERAGQHAQQAELADAISQLIAASPELLAEFRQRSQEQPLLLHLVAQRLVERGEPDIAPANIRSLLEEQLAMTPDNTVVQKALTGALLQSVAPQWSVLTPTQATATGGETFAEQPDGSLLVEGHLPDRAIYSLTMRPGLKSLSALRLETIPDHRLPHQGAGRCTGNGNFHLSEFRVERVPSGAAGEAVPLPITATATGATSKTGFSPFGAIDGRLDTRWDVDPQQKERQWAVFAWDAPAAFDGDSLRITLDSGVSPWGAHGLGRFRLSATDHPDALRQSARIAGASHIADPRAKLGAAYAVVGEPARAIDYFRQALARPQDRDPRLALTKQIAAFATTDADLLPVFAELLRQDPQQTELLVEIAAQAFLRGEERDGPRRLSQVRAMLEARQAGGSSNAEVQSALAQLLLESIAPKWTVLSPAEFSSRDGATLQRLTDQSVLAVGTNPKVDAYTLKFVNLPERVQSLRLEAMPHETLPYQGPGRSDGGNFVLTGVRTRFQPAAGKGSELELSLTKAVADFEQVSNSADHSGYPIAAALNRDSETDGWAVNLRQGRTTAAVLTWDQPGPGGDGTSLILELDHFSYFTGHNLGRFRVSATDDATAFTQESRRFAAMKFSDARVRLAAAYALTNQEERAAELLAEHPEALQQFLSDGGRIGASFDRVLDRLQNRAPERFAEKLPEIAAHAAATGDMETARATYQRLIKLQPQAARWKERLARLPPGTIARWDFDSDLGFWKNSNNCTLAVQDGVVTLTEVGPRPRWFCNAAPSVGGNVLAVRYRCERPFRLEYYCGDLRSDVQQAQGTKIGQISGTAGGWNELLLPLSYTVSLDAIRLDFMLGAGQSIEIDDLVLRQVNDAELAKLWRDVVSEPALTQLKADIELDPSVDTNYDARATYLIRLGRWREAAQDSHQARLLRPTDRLVWFREANCRLLADDFASYKQLCQEMIEQFRGTNNAEIADSLSKTCLLGPDAVALADLPLEFVRASLDDPNQAANQHWFYVCNGLAAFRGGKPDEALAWVQKHPNYSGNSGAMALMIRAMAEHQLGRREEARRTLAQAERLIPSSLRVRATSGPPSHPLDVTGDMLANEVLRREAAQRIRGEPATGADGEAP